MSNTYSLTCHPMRLKLWVGQGSSHGFILYGDDEYHEALRQFFEKTMFQPLVLEIDGGCDELIFYEEFKPQIAK